MILTAAFWATLPLAGLGAATFFPEGIDGVALAAHKNPATSHRRNLYRLILFADAHLDALLNALLSLCEPQVFLEVLRALVDGADLRENHWRGDSGKGASSGIAQGISPTRPLGHDHRLGTATAE